MSKKKMLIVIAIIIVLVIIVVVSILMSNGVNNSNNKSNVTSNLDKYEKYVQPLEDGSKINVSNKLLETKEYEGLEISNTSLEWKNGVTVLVADVINKGSTTKEQQKIYVVLEDKDKNEITRLSGIIDKVEPGKKVQINITTTKDVANVYDFRIEERH